MHAPPGPAHASRSDGIAGLLLFFGAIISIVLYRIRNAIANMRLPLDEQCLVCRLPGLYKREAPNAGIGVCSWTHAGGKVCRGNFVFTPSQMLGPQ
jgi:hypothetical protein